jgi:pilus assembly protein CpaB
MRTQSLLIVAIAMACAGTAGLLLSGSPGTAATVPVVVAAAEIPRGAVVAAESLTVRPFPKGLVPEGALGRIEDAAGRSALGLLGKGEAVLEVKLAPKGATGGIAALIPSGMRAIAIQIPNVATGVAGFILPGNKVDVLISYNERPGFAPVPLPAETLLENVEILAVDQRIEAPAENRVDASQMRSVTLLVTPEQAARLHEAMNKGTLHLSLRNPADTSRGPRQSARAALFFDGLARALAAAASRAPRPAPPRTAQAVPVREPAELKPEPAPPPRLVRAVRSNRESIVTLNPGH